jgi:NAD(P)-dependent dehydrogenase (short-subunit alcohol dehydrogenase family)
MGMLDDRIAVVTGGGGGVGWAVCERFETEGAIVYAGDLSDGGSVGGDAVYPGYVDTPMLQSFFQENGDIDSLQQTVRYIHPLRTCGTPTDIANLVNWLASDEARYASGQLWGLDGGLSAQVQQMRL